MSPLVRDHRFERKVVRVVIALERLGIDGEQVFSRRVAPAVLRAARLLAGKLDIEIEAEMLPEAPCSGDELLLRQAIMILLDNAVKYSGAGSTVRVSLANAANDRTLTLAP